MEDAAGEALEFLENAKKAVNRLEEAKAERQNLSQTELRLKKRLMSEEKAVEDAISVTTKKRKDEVSISYDKELSEAQENLKKLKNQKEQAKNAGKKERIQSETAQLREESRALTEELRTLLKKNRVPRIGRTKWFYTIFMPSGLWERLVDTCLLLLFLFILPYLCFLGLPTDNPLILSVLHFAFFVVFGGIYMGISSKVKYAYYDTLKQAVLLREKLENNRKKVRLITASINKDPNEEHYDLEDYNYSIAKVETQIEEIGRKKQEAMQTFEAVTKNVIADEIREGSRAKIENLRAEIDINTKNLATAKERVSALAMELTDKYEGRLGRENLQKDALEQLLMQIRSGSATSVTDAINNYRNTRS